MDELLAEAGIKTVLTGIRMPRMNSIMERWVQSCRREFLDRCLLWKERHLRHALREYERFYNQHRAIKSWPKPPRCVPSGSDHRSPTQHTDEADSPNPPQVLTCPPDLHGWNFGRRRKPRLLSQLTRDDHPPRYRG